MAGLGDMASEKLRCLREEADAVLRPSASWRSGSSSGVRVAAVCGAPPVLARHPAAREGEVRQRELQEVRRHSGTRLLLEEPIVAIIGSVH
jgi:hypothetical protein